MLQASKFYKNTKKSLFSRHLPSPTATRSHMVPGQANKIGQFLSQASENAQISKSDKITNHSVRKTCIKSLFCHTTVVAQLNDHKNAESLESCAVTSHDQQKSMSKILSGKTPSINAERPPRRKGRLPKPQARLFLPRGGGGSGKTPI